MDSRHHHRLEQPPALVTAATASPSTPTAHHHHDSSRRSSVSASASVHPADQPPRSPSSSVVLPVAVAAAAAAADRRPDSALPPRRQSDSSHLATSRASDPILDPERLHRPPSTSSLPSIRDLGAGRAMPPPTQTPPPHLGQQQLQHQPPHHQHSHSAGSYGPPPPRPPVGVGPPPSSSFGSGRDLPALNSLTRSSPGAGSSMSISSMLGGPPPASRESQPPPAHYSPHSAPPTASASQYGPSVHASPRMHSASSEYNPFRRPQTPDHQRSYDPRGSAAPSPRGHYATTPDAQRYGTPQSYHARHPSAPADTGRDTGRMSAGPPNTPGNQPKPFGSLPRPMDLGRAPQEDPYARREDPRHGADYLDRNAQRHYPFDDRYRLERDRQPGSDQREREAREHAYASGEPRHGPPELNPRNQPPYPRHSEPADRREPPRDQHWSRQGHDPNYRAPMEHQRGPSEYPPASGPYAPHASAYQTAPPQHQDRYAPTSHPHPQGSAGGAPPSYDSSDRGSLERLHPGARPREDHHQQQPSAGYHNPAHGPTPYDPARQRNGDDPSNQIHQRNLLGVQDMNRKGRMSPLPQAVQGAQPQQPGPAGEPGIKSEFGRMFAGIGSGVGNMGASSPITSAPSGQSGAGSMKRDDEDAAAEGAKKPRRRKLKDEADRPDDESSGRGTPVGRGAKRVKGHHHHHHHHHHHAPDSVSSPLVGITPLKSGKGSTPIDNAGDKNAAHHHHHHHHHHHPGRAQSSTPQPKPVEAPVIPPKTKTVVSSKAALDSVSHKPRHHLGDLVYETEIKTGRLVPRTSTNRGFSSTPKPLPLERIKGKENSILTIKVPRVHLTPVAREEITSRAFLWGTDVYTDDSDVVAACIHSGWIMGEWTEDVDTAMLSLDKDGKETKKTKLPAELTSEGVISSPPKSGPMPIPANRDLHINILVLPRLLKYGACTRYGITSREFGGEFGSRHAVHDGVSYMVQSIRWVANGGQSQARLRGQARRDRMRKAMIEVNASLGNINGPEREREKERLNKLRSEITGNWWKQEAADAAKDSAAAAKTDAPPPQAPVGGDGDKENRTVEEKKPAAVDVAETKEVPADTDVEMGEAQTGKAKDVDEKAQAAA